MKSAVTMTVNGASRTAEVESRTLLVHLLREHLNMTGTHIGCDTSNCGSCTVWLDGEAVKSCIGPSMRITRCSAGTARRGW